MFLWMPLATILVAEVVVDGFDGVTLVCPKDRAQDIKQMVMDLREKRTFDELL